MPDIRVGAKHWQLIACSTDQLSVLNNLPILLGTPEKPPLASWKLPPFEQPLLQEVLFPSTRGGGGIFSETTHEVSSKKVSGSSNH